MKKALMISCFDWYKKRLEPIKDIYIQKGYDVTVIMSDYNHVQKNPIQERFDECTYIHVLPYKKNISFRRIRSHLMFGKTVSLYIDKIQPDLIHLQMPPNNTARYCTEYKKAHPKTKLIVDIIDLWPESMPLGRFNNSRIAQMWSNWRNECIKMADYVFTECKLYQDKLRDILGSKQPATLHLFKEQTKDESNLVKSIISNKTDNARSIKLSYLGSINNIIDIDGICKVLSNLCAEGYDCELHVIGKGENEEYFQEAISKTGCKAISHGAIFDEKEKIQILTPCDFAFNMMKDNVAVGLTIKSIDYLSYGLPLINNIKGDTWDLVRTKAAGINVNENGVINLQEIVIDHNHIVDLFRSYFSKEAYIETAAQYLKQL